MTVDLYNLLGVERNATVKKIRSAYRAKAKKAHPDMPNGSAEEFARLKLAHDILTDPVRRLKYDNTGDTSEKVCDNGMSQVIGELAGALEHVLAQIDKRAGNPTEFELVNDMKILLGGKLDEAQNRKKSLEALKKKTEKLQGRFGIKEGENYLEAIVASKLSSIDNSICMIDAQEEPIKKALDILCNSSFRSDYGGSKNGHTYGKNSAYHISDLMNQALFGSGL